MFWLAIVFFILWIAFNLACFVILIARTDTSAILPVPEESETSEFNWTPSMLDEREFIN